MRATLRLCLYFNKCTVEELSEEMPELLFLTRLYRKEGVLKTIQSNRSHKLSIIAHGVAVQSKNCMNIFCS